MTNNDSYAQPWRRLKAYRDDKAVRAVLADGCPTFSEEELRRDPDEHIGDAGVAAGVQRDFLRAA